MGKDIAPLVLPMFVAAGILRRAAGNSWKVVGVAPPASSPAHRRMEFERMVFDMRRNSMLGLLAWKVHALAVREAQVLTQLGAKSW